jgi:RNA polymerase sigma-70 factor (ECF subfamily)
VVGISGGLSVVEAKRAAHEGEEALQNATIREDFVAFYKEQYKKVVGFIIFSGGSLHEAEEAVSEAFAQAYPQWDKIEHPRAWIRTVATRAFFRERQLRQKRVRDLPEDETLLPDTVIASVDILQAVEGHDWVEWMIKELTPRQQEVMRGIVEGLSTYQVAQLLGTNRTNIRSHLRHIRPRLKDRLDLVATMVSPPTVESDPLANPRKEGA